jgi:DNA-binding Lrp family transcriptional regulator
MKRRKNFLDGIDREIIRVLYSRKSLSSRQIAKYVGLSSPGIFPRLNHLKSKGIIKISRVYGFRIFEREFGNKLRKIKSPQSIYWGLDLKSKNEK